MLSKLPPFLFLLRSFNSTPFLPCAFHMAPPIWKERLPGFDGRDQYSAERDSNWLTKAADVPLPPLQPPSVDEVKPETVSTARFSHRDPWEYPPGHKFNLSSFNRCIGYLSSLNRTTTSPAPKASSVNVVFICFFASNGESLYVKHLDCNHIERSVLTCDGGL